MSIGSSEVLKDDEVLETITKASRLFQAFMTVYNKASVMQGALPNKCCNLHLVIF